jgi:hypothetical protein
MKELPIPGPEELMEYYCSQLSNAKYPIENWMFAVAFSFFRVISLSLVYFINILTLILYV